MDKWLNGAQARKREIDGKDTRIAALAAAGAVQSAGQVPVATACRMSGYITSPSVDLPILIRRLS